MKELIKFKSVQHLNENDFVEFTKKLSVSKAIQIMFIVLALIYCFVIAVLIVSGNYSWLGFQIILIGFAFTFGITYPKLIAKNTYKNSAALRNDNPIYNEIIFTDNRIYDNTKNSNAFYEYYQIQNVVESKNMFILFITKTTAVIVKKDSFTIGSPAEFVNFINQKRFEKMNMNQIK